MSEPAQEDVTLSSFSSMLPGDAEVEDERMDEDATESTPLQAPDATEPSPAAAAEPVASTSTSGTTSAPAPAASAPATPPPAPTPIILTTNFQNGTTREWSLTYFHPPSRATGPSAAAVLSSLPDSYFSPTPSELQTAFAGQVRKREELVDRPLLTKAYRDKEAGGKMEEKRKRWPETRIRIRFADRSLLEGVLKSTDLLGAVYEMVKVALHEDVRAKPFILYQTPPKREFKRADPQFKGKSLLALEFTPAAVLYFKFEDEDLNDPNKPPPLLADVLGCATPLPLPPAFDPTAADDKADQAKPRTTSSNKLGFGGSSGKVVPAWMKMGGKSGKK
ncbi:hypothetical protein RQP46_004184 [Phenoliferia psychrophenolica]